jgi:hypothetical protein
MSASERGIDTNRLNAEALKNSRQDLLAVIRKTRNVLSLFLLTGKVGMRAG